MKIRRHENQLDINSPSKVNLTLELLEKRADGFHELETVMTTINLCDRIRFTPRDDSKLSLKLHTGFDAIPDQDEIPVDERNLIIKALQLVRQSAGIDRGMSVGLLKRIPSQAGLGGASGNAAAALIAANELWKLNWSLEKLQSLGAELGSDVPFFLTGGAAICRGRGEKITPVLCPSRFWLVIAKPPVGLSTAKVYQEARVPDESLSSDPILSAMASADSSSVGHFMFNRLEHFAASLSPWIVQLQKIFQQLNCQGHQLSGSGTSYFGIFANFKSASLAAKYLSNRLPMVKIFTSHTLSRVAQSDPFHALAG